MRMTLRTLLAWLDDTLSPGEVREIGLQVSDSSFAKELVDRIHKVTRQRRLSVPPSSGPDAVDANLVARYLDNDLEPELVAEIEKKCLTSDVHLAEVASVHQILSMIGQKAKVPAEARRRMYQLIKGREAVKAKAPRASRQTEPVQVSEPVQPWVTPPPPPGPGSSDSDLWCAVLGLILILCWTAWKTLTPPEASPQLVPKIAMNSNGERARCGGRSTRQAANRPGCPRGRGRHSLEPAPAPAAVPTDDETKTEGPTPEAKPKDAEPEKKAELPPSDVPSGAVGLVKKPTGVLLRHNTERRDWDRLVDATALHEQDRLLGLEPFRSTVEFGSALVDLVGETEVWAGATPTTEAARFTLAQGKVVLHGTTPTRPFEVHFGGKTVSVLPPAGGTVGLQRMNRRASGEAKPLPAVLRVFATDGPVKIKASGHEETLDSAGAVSVEPTGAFTDKVAKAPPSWVTETEPASFDLTVGKQFLKFFRADRPIVSSFVEASEDEDKYVARKAIEALRAVGDQTYIVPLLNKKGDAAAATARREAIAVLRDFLSRDDDSAKALHDQLKRDFGDELGATAEKLLIGYTPKEAADPMTYSKLVQLLGTTEDGQVGIRELALDNLMRLTGRDDLEYDPENPKPESKGLRAWRELLRSGELRAAGATG